MGLTSDKRTLLSEVKVGSVVSDSLRPHGPYSPWNSPGQNMGVGSLPFSRGSSHPRDRTQVSYIAGGFFTAEHCQVKVLLNFPALAAFSVGGTHSGLQGSTPSAGEGWGGYTAIKPKTGKAGASLRKMGVASREGHQIMTTRVNAQEMCVGNIITSHAERQPTNALGHRHFSQWYRKCNLHGKENPKQKEYTDMYSWFTLLYSRK